MRAAAAQQAQEAAHRLTHAAIVGAGTRVAASHGGLGGLDRQRSSGSLARTPSTASAGALGTRSPSAGSTASSVDLAVHARPPGSGPRPRQPTREGSRSEPARWLGALGAGAGQRGASPASPSAERQTGEEVAREMLEVLLRPPSTSGGHRLPWPSSTQLCAEERLDAGAPLLPAGGRAPPPAGRGGGSPGASGMDAPADSLDRLLLGEELRRCRARLARATAAPELVESLDLPGLAQLRAELVEAHAASLERVDDRRVALQAKQAAAREGPERGRCVACWSRSADRLLLPCRHLCLCGTCLQSCVGQCPICRAAIKDSIEVFGNG